MHHTVIYSCLLLSSCVHSLVPAVVGHEWDCDAVISILHHKGEDGFCAETLAEDISGRLVPVAVDLRRSGDEVSTKFVDTSCRDSIFRVADESTLPAGADGFMLSVVEDGRRFHFTIEHVSLNDRPPIACDMCVFRTVFLDGELSGTVEFTRGRWTIFERAEPSTALAPE